MSKRTIGFVLIVIGAVMAVVSLGADAIGIGKTDKASVGNSFWEQPSVSSWSSSESGWQCANQPRSSNRLLVDQYLYRDQGMPEGRSMGTNQPCG
jgi:hypothetical protein